MHRNRFLRLAVITAMMIGLVNAVTGQDVVPHNPHNYPVYLNNYVRSWNVLAPGKTSSSIPTLTTQDAQQSTNYFDGLGRPLQTVMKQAAKATGASEAKDVVSMIEYDDYGRQRRSYLPYASQSNNGAFKVSAFDEQSSFYQSYFGSQGETYFYSKVNYENTSLNRVAEKYSPGNSWMGTESAASPDDRRSVKMKYLSNTADDDVRIWNVTPGTGGAFSTYESPGEYPEGELYKDISEDEHGKQVVQFINKEGKLILKKVQLSAQKDPGSGKGHQGWLCTYYLYDDLGLLRCAIQPEGVKTIAPSWILSDANLLAEQCFRYEYDERNRLIAKKTPGAAVIYMIYDQRDRLVFTQDGNMRSSNEWFTTLYDALNRPVLTGKITYTGLLAALRSEVSNQTEAPSNPAPGVPIDKVLTQGNATGIETALRSVTLDPGFETVDGYDFSAEIVEGAGGVNGETTVIAGVGIEKNPLPAGVELYVLTKTFYDNYDWLNHENAQFTAFRDNSHDIFFEPGSNNYPYPQPHTQSFATEGKGTGTKVRVLGSDQFLYTITYYDDYGRAIQTKNSNATGGIDLTSVQYSWSGDPLIVAQKFDKADGVSHTTDVVTRRVYDDLGRLVSLQKRQRNTLVNGNELSEYKTLSSMDYDDLGRVKVKKLAPYFDNNNGLETQALDYNIRGWILGLNRDDLSSNGDNGSYFAFDLGYDKMQTASGRDYVNRQLNGNITGMIWKSKGDGIRRKYDFRYDAANRFLKGDFEQNDEDAAWGNSVVNYKVVMGDENNEEQTAYDANGNILKMQQWGWTLTGSKQIDHLHYTYKPGSNKLHNVVDFSNDPVTELGDFRTAASHTENAIKSTLTLSSPQIDFDGVEDYAYDPNGNLLSDENKGITSIVYNHLNLPSVVTTRKGTITYTYDAVGNKIKVAVHEPNGSVQYGNDTHSSGIVTTTTYLGGAIYQKKSYDNAVLSSLNQPDKLQFINMEEGRIRLNEENAAMPYVYDYVIKDHLGNIRMILTDEENRQRIYPVVSLEAGKLSIEKEFYSIDDSKIVDNTSGLPTYTNDNGIGNNPADASFENANSTKLYKLNGNTNKLGLGITLKVMAGDKIDIYGRSFWQTANGGGEPANVAPVVLDVLSSLLGAPVSGSINGHAGGALDAVVDVRNPINNFLGNSNRVSQQSATRPKAFINYIFLDEQFRMVNGNFSAVSSSAGMKSDHINELQDLEAQKNGYVYIYVSNESPVDVFFDNLQIVHKPGQILEESHYYPFGLMMAGISAKSLNGGGAKNNYHFNGGSELHNKEFSNGDGLELYDAQYRMFDPQIGRFNRIDPLSDFYDDLTPYNFAFDNPILFNDPTGLSPELGLVQNITGYIYGPNGIYFDPDVHDQSDLGPDSRSTYLGDRIKLTRSDGTSVWFDENGKSTSVDPGWQWGNLAGVTVRGVRYKTRNFGFYLDAVENNYNGVKDYAELSIGGIESIKRGDMVKTLYDVNKAYKYYNGVNILKPGATATKIISGVRGAGKIVQRLGPLGTALSVGNVITEVATGTWDAHTVVDGALLATTAVVGAVAAAPVVAVVAVGTAIYGALDYAFDIGDKLDAMVGRKSKFVKWIGSLFD